MSYKVIVDSCGELTPEMKASGIFETASLTIEVGGHHIVDDETFDQKQFLQYVAEAAECPKSSCPSPEKYMEKYDCDVDRVYAVTLSAELSGSYNSAVLGMNLYHEEHGEKNIHVFNSCSASIGETLIALKIRECEEQGMTYEQVIETVEAYIESQHTYFVLETLDTLRKNGRLTGIKALVATALNIKPVMGATPEGTIYQIGQGRGMKKSLGKMAESVLAELSDPQNKILAISHCNCPERAEAVKEQLVKHATFKDVIVFIQGHAALYTRSNLTKEEPLIMLHDIGGFTWDYLSVRNGNPEKDIMDTRELGIIPFYNEFSNYIVSEYDLHLREDDIDNLIKNRTLPSNLAAIQTKVLDTLDTMALQYLKRGIKTFIEDKIDLKMYTSVFVGGASLIFKPYILQLQEEGLLGKVIFIEDVHANAKGAQILYKSAKSIMNKQ